jgi:aspartyl-tRNA synthetase
VPSRLHPGQFYALPQAPQQFKQLIMVAGFDRYFQIAPVLPRRRCARRPQPGRVLPARSRDELRHPGRRVRRVEPVLHGVFRSSPTAATWAAPFPHITYEDSMLKYGNDKPDLRNPIVIADVSDVFARADVEFKASRTRRCAPFRRRAPGQPRSFFDKIDGWAKSEMGAAGLGYIVLEGGAARQGPDCEVPRQPSAGALSQSAGCKPAMPCSSRPMRRRNAPRSSLATPHAHRRELGLINEKSSASAGSSIFRCMSGTKRRRDRLLP